MHSTRTFGIRGSNNIVSCRPHLEQELDNDNDNDNEIFFIAKRYTVHHQHIDKGNNTYHMCEKYKPGKGGLKPLLMCPNIK